MRYIYTFLCLVLAFYSCDDALDVTPDGRTTLEDIFKNEVQTEAYLNTVYLVMPSWFYSYQNYSLLAGSTDEAEDSVTGNGDPNMNVSWNRGELTVSNNPGINYYSAFWSGIRHANIFLKYIDDANVESKSKRSRLKAEAKLLRAFYYWELTKQYGAMPVFDFAPDADFDYGTVKRPSFDEVVDFIVKECNDVILNPDVPLRNTTEADRSRFTKAVAYALKSQALLYKASPLWNQNNDASKWENASEAALSAYVALSQKDEYQLFNDYGEYFLTRSDYSTSPKDRETIFELPYRADRFFISSHNIPSKTGMTKVGSTPSQELVDAYGMQETGEPTILGYQDEQHLRPIINESSGYDPQNPYIGRDPRFYATVWYNGAEYDNINGNIHTIETFTGGKDQLLKNPPNITNTHTGYYLKKFIDPKLQIGSQPNVSWKKYRFAEILLNYAEAENELNGPTGDVYFAINQVRNRSSMPNVQLGLSKNEMRETIRRERQVEFAFEEHRFWDVRRWKILDKTDKLITGMEITKNDGNLIYKRFVVNTRNAWQAKFLIFPIPLSDAVNVPDFVENQNPGW